MQSWEGTDTNAMKKAGNRYSSKFLKVGNIYYLRESVLALSQQALAIF